MAAPLSKKQRQADKKAPAKINEKQMVEKAKKMKKEKKESNGGKKKKEAVVLNVKAPDGWRETWQMVLEPVKLLIPPIFFLLKSLFEKCGG